MRKSKKKGRARVQFCPKDHDTFVVGRVPGGRCMQCVLDYRVSIKKPRQKKQICKRGHDTFLPGGRTKLGACKLCIRIRLKRYKKSPKHIKWITKNKKKIASCQKAYRKVYLIVNKDKIKKRKKKWDLKNKKRKSNYNKKWYKEHRKEKLAKNKKWIKENPWWKRLQDLKRQKKRRLRIPKFGQKGIKNFYKKCSKKKVVDHYIPLLGKLVSGLHVIWNFQYLTPKQNRKKGNRINLKKVSQEYGKLLKKLGLK